MKFADKYLPMIENGGYTINIAQKIETFSPDPDDLNKSIKGEDDFCTSKDFKVISRGFTLMQSDVFSVYPEENARGQFGNELPFLVSPVKTLPWLYGDGKYPWIVLIAAGEQDAGIREQDISISQLLSEIPEEIFFPTDKMPEQFSEAPDELCHIVDIPLELFREIMPKMEETQYLCHGKYADLSSTEEKISSMDGFFSVVMGNRFISEGKNTLYLVSVHGYPDYDSAEYEGCSFVRLVSLYHWNVFCEHETEADFKSTVRRLSVKVFGGEEEQILRKRGVCAKLHYLRSGDRTGSLYHSPLVPYKIDEMPQIRQPCHSADSVLIYDKEKAIFDVTYSAAWQLGKMLTLSGNLTVRAVTEFREGVRRGALRRRQSKMVELRKLDYKRYCGKLAVMWKNGQ